MAKWKEIPSPEAIVRAAFDQRQREEAIVRAALERAARNLGQWGDIYGENAAQVCYSLADDSEAVAQIIKKAGEAND